MNHKIHKNCIFQITSITSVEHIIKYNKISSFSEWKYTSQLIFLNISIDCQLYYTDVATKWIHLL